MTGTEPFTYDVIEVQTILRQLGLYRDQIDGIVGPNTEAAVVKFKDRQGLRPRPYVGPVTLAALRAAAPRAAPPDAPTLALPWMVEISKFLGLHEVRDNAALRDWLKSDGATLGDPAELPWCGDAAATALKKTLPNEPWPPALLRNPYWARNFGNFGDAVVDCYGAVGVFSRGSGGHVAFVIGRNARGDRLRIRGGNQGDMIRDDWIARDRLLAMRWPQTWTGADQRPLPILSDTGAVLSTNEA